MWGQIRCAMTALGLLQLAGCGTYVPPMQEFWETSSFAGLDAGGVLEYNIREKVYCDILGAVEFVRGKHLLPPGWAVQTTLDLQVFETGAVNPGATFIRPIFNGTDTFSLGIGGTLSAQGTREDKFGSYWNMDKLKSLKQASCDGSDTTRGSSLLLESNLGITQWLYNTLYIDYFNPSSEVTKDADGAFKQEYLSYHIQFVVISSGSATPTWKLVRLTTGNGSLPLVGANRTRTHDLLLTFGPAYKPGSPNFAIASHQAQELGIAASNGNRTIFAPITSPQGGF